MWILSTYVTSKGEGREGGERRGEQTMNRDKEKAERERERESTEGYIDSKLVCMLHRV